MSDWFLDLWHMTPYGHFIEPHFKDWLYGGYDETKLRHFNILHNIPVFGDYMDYLLDSRADKEYLSRYGMDYSDIHDPRKLRSTGSGSRLVGSSLNFVSKNVSRLYR